MACILENAMTSSVYLLTGEGLQPITEDGESETISCLLDVMAISLTEMDLYSAVRIEGDYKEVSKDVIKYHGYYLKSDTNRPLRER